MISERTLKVWRREALKDQKINLTSDDHRVSVDFVNIRCQTQSERILRMTQELLDQHLVRK